MQLRRPLMTAMTIVKGGVASCGLSHPHRSRRLKTEMLLDESQGTKVSTNSLLALIRTPRPRNYHKIEKNFSASSDRRVRRLNETNMYQVRLLNSYPRPCLLEVPRRQSTACHAPSPPCGSTFEGRRPRVRRKRNLVSRRRSPKSTTRTVS